MNRATFAGRNTVTVGETWSATLMWPCSTAPARRELSMVFQFDHVMSFWDKNSENGSPTPLICLH
jgi:oligo-1,6-glucosidase